MPLSDWIPVLNQDGEGVPFWTPMYDGQLLGWREINVVFRYDHSFYSKLDGKCYHVLEVVAHGPYVAPHSGMVSLPDSTPLEVVKTVC